MIDKEATVLLYITFSIYFRKCKVNFLSDSISYWVIPLVPSNILVVVSVAEVFDLQQDSPCFIQDPTECLYNRNKEEWSCNFGHSEFFLPILLTEVKKK